jgi:cell wall-associated NlpC family hydrolase
MRAMLEFSENNDLKMRYTHFGNFKLPRQAKVKPGNLIFFQKIIHLVGIQLQINQFLHFLVTYNA